MQVVPLPQPPPEAPAEVQKPSLSLLLLGAKHCHEVQVPLVIEKLLKTVSVACIFLLGAVSMPRRERKAAAERSRCSLPSPSSQQIETGEANANAPAAVRRTTTTRHVAGILIASQVPCRKLLPPPACLLTVQ